MKFLHCVTSSNSKRSSRKHRKSPRRRRRSSRSSYVSPSSTTKRSHFHQTDNSSGIRTQNRNAFHQTTNDYNAIDVNPMNHLNAMNYIEMGVPPTIFEHQVYSNNHNSSQKLHSNVNQFLKMSSKIYPSTSSGYQSVVNQYFPRGNVLYSGVEKKRRRKVSEITKRFNGFHSIPFLR